jgi:hypothetical protein
VRLALLASRGLLDKHVPEEHRNLLMLMKMAGIDTEISVDVYRSIMLAAAMKGNHEAAVESRMDFLQAYCPEMKDERTSFMEMAQNALTEIAKNPISRVSISQDQKVDPRLVKTTYREQ